MDIINERLQKIREESGPIFDNPFRDDTGPADEASGANPEVEVMVKEIAQLEIEDAQDVTQDPALEKVQRFTEIQQLRANYKRNNRNEFTDAGRIKYINPLEFTLKEWDIDEIPPDCSCLFTGKRRSGKSTLARYIFWRLKNAYPWAHIFDGSAASGTYRNMFPGHAVTKGWDPDLMQALQDQQDNLVEQATMGKLPSNFNHYGLIWMDDIMNRHTRADERIEEAYTKGRHLALMVGFNSQRYTGVTPTIRENTDIVIFFGTNHTGDKRMLAEEFLGGLNSATARELIDMYTQDHHAIVIENWRNTSDVEEYVKVVRAPEEVPAFQFGTEDFWAGTVGLDTIKFT